MQATARTKLFPDPFPDVLGAHLEDGGVRFGVYAHDATAVHVCLFDAGGAREVDRIVLRADARGCWTGFAPGLKAGAVYGLRADGRFEPSRGLWFDPAKLLVDPFATRLDRPFRFDPALSIPRGRSVDTAGMVPKAIVETPVARNVPPMFPEGHRAGDPVSPVIYELAVRAFTLRHPDVPAHDRGTIRALRHPSVIAHFRKLGITHVELMPVVAWIDERHLPPLGLTNAWGYNPVSFMAMDPRLAPGGIADLRAVSDALAAEGIGVILDLVFNHTGESDALGPTLSLRGLAARQCFRQRRDGTLINDTGTGNTIACDHPFVVRLVTDALRHFVLAGGVSGFRFDLGTILGRTAHGFAPDAPLFAAMLDDPVLATRLLIAEPWDIGPGGYHLGGFPPSFLEWNDRWRDDVRRFWRGDAATLGAFATRLAGSSDIFRRSGQGHTRSVAFIATHDGFTLADTVAHSRKHNHANGEDNRDGHNENFSWNNGVEGPSSDSAIVAARRRDMRALLATLFASRGPIQITAGDEFGRSQRGNNNAYCQDNEISWIDWKLRDRDLEDFVAALSALRRKFPALGDPAFLEDENVDWLAPDGRQMGPADWSDFDRRSLTKLHNGAPARTPVAIMVNGAERPFRFVLPDRGGEWMLEEPSSGAVIGGSPGTFVIAPRSIAFASLNG